VNFLRVLSISCTACSVDLPGQLVPVLQGGRMLISFPSQHGGVVVSFASLRNNLRRTMASRALPNSSMMTSVTILGNGF
ncbi:hypothetical protein L9F63_017130, partial [Diploptera punctata]